MQFIKRLIFLFQFIHSAIFYLFLLFLDPRVSDWPMMSDPLPTILICATYALIVTTIGPKLMENRKPFELKRTLIVYNALQVIFSAWLFSEVSQ